MSDSHSHAPPLPLAHAEPRRHAWVLPHVLPLAATWLLVFGGVLAFLWPLSMLFDSDSYYHLAIARAYLQQGLISNLPWARFSAMHVGFGDKELLFHLLLLPAAAASDPVSGAKVTLAVLDASILTSVGYLAWRAAGARALLVPGLVLIGSFWFDMRLIRLRPELLALLLLLWLVHALSQRRALLAAACTCAFALGYTAFQLPLGMCGLCFILFLALDREPSWRLLLWPTAGAIVGLCLHPHFPHNLRIFYLQNFEFWRYQSTDDIGNEILALGWGRWVRYDWPLLLGCLFLFASMRRAQHPPPLDRPTRDAALVYGTAALPLLLLFVHSGRFALYGVPFGVLAALWVARLQGMQLDARVWLLGRAGPRAWLVFLLLGCASLPLTAAALRAQLDFGGCVWPAQRNGLEALGRVLRALPQPAKVAAPWDSSEDYMYFAPQGRYLNVLDPLFMRSAHPQAYQAQRALFAGQLPDVPLTLQTTLDSDFLAFSAREYPALRQQLAHDPRLDPLLAQGELLYRVVPERARAFVRDFRVARSQQQLSQPSAAGYPRYPTAAGRTVEGVIDTSRLPASLLSAAGCLWFAPQASPEHASPAVYELASTAPTHLWVGGRNALELPASVQLLLGKGTHVHIARPDALTIEICPTDRAAATFYLLRRDRGAR